MKRSLLSLPLLALLPSCIVVIADGELQWDDEGRARGPRASSWTVLMDGSSLDAWRGFRSEGVPAGWALEGGALARVGPAGDLITREQWSDFELVFDWKVSEGANSGVFFHVTEDRDAVWRTGPEYQILDNARHADGGDPKTSAASNYALHAPTGDYTRPVGEWNQGRLVVEDGRVTHWLNGYRVVEYELWTDAWKARVADSKFAAMPDYGQRRRGHVALQDHGDLVWFRNVKIRALD